METIEGLERIILGLADKTRLRIINLIGSRALTVNEVTSTLGLAQPKVSRHLAYLRETGLVDTRRDGKHIYYSLSTRNGSTPLVKAAMEALASISGEVSLMQERPVEFARHKQESSSHISGEPNMYGPATNEIETFLL
jgi:ArsR family transcriptional regulator